MKILAYILASMALLQCTPKATSIEGNWVWTYESSQGQKHKVHLYLSEGVDNFTTGYYCSSYGNGAKVDCSEENNQSIQLKKVANTSFQGSFRSSFSAEKGVLRIRKTSQEAIYVDIKQEPAGEFYFPDEVVFKKVGTMKNN